MTGFFSNLTRITGLNAGLSRYSAMNRLNPQTLSFMRQFTACLLFFLSINAFGQKSDTVQRLNTIRLDLLTSNLLYSDAFIMSYERVVKRNQSFVITAGPERFPSIASFGDHIKVKENRKKTGVKFGVEYRFYLKKENKFNAPRGVYVGPYVSYHNFHNDRLLTYTNPDGSTVDATFDAKLNVLNVGAQLGYQFIIGNRWAIDLMFIGPSVSRYSAKLNLDGNFSDLQLDDAQQEIVDKLLEKFPLLKDTIDEGEVTVKGNNSTWSAGWRYQFQVGYHFGRKKK
jgi:hypothetical protein